jgi:hypothetical protein
MYGFLSLAISPLILVYLVEKLRYQQYLTAKVRTYYWIAMFGCVLSIVMGLVQVFSFVAR